MVRISATVHLLQSGYFVRRDQLLAARHRSSMEVRVDGTLMSPEGRWITKSTAGVFFNYRRAYLVSR